MEDSIFTKIIKGEIPCYKIYEDDRTFAILDIHPKTPGHTLVIPKAQIEHVWDLSDDDYQAVMESARKVAHRIRDVLNPDKVGLQIEGLGVPHVHVHVFPFATHEEFLVFPDLNAESDHQALTEMAQKLTF